MKLITLSISLLLLTGCFGRREYKPQFKVGDCIMQESAAENAPESWETKKKYNGYVHKILEVGHRKYLTLTMNPEATMVYKSDSSFFYDDIMTTVNCPVELGAFYD